MAARRPPRRRRRRLTPAADRTSHATGRLASRWTLTTANHRRPIHLTGLTISRLQDRDRRGLDRLRQPRPAARPGPASNHAGRPPTPARPSATPAQPAGNQPAPQSRRQARCLHTVDWARPPSATRSTSRASPTASRRTIANQPDLPTSGTAQPPAPNRPALHVGVQVGGLQEAMEVHVAVQRRLRRVRIMASVTSRLSTRVRAAGHDETVVASRTTRCVAALTGMTGMTALWNGLRCVAGTMRASRRRSDSLAATPRCRPDHDVPPVPAGRRLEQPPAARRVVVGPAAARSSPAARRRSRCGLGGRRGRASWRWPLYWPGQLAGRSAHLSHWRCRGRRRSTLRAVNRAGSALVM